MYVRCSGCGKSLALGTDLVWELNLSVKVGGSRSFQDVWQDDNIQEWLTISRSFCEKCRNEGKATKEFRRIKEVFIKENS